MSKDVNKFETFLEELFPKTSNEKNRKKIYVYKPKSCLPIFEMFELRV